MDSDRDIVREGFLNKIMGSGETRVVYVWLLDDVLLWAKMLPGTGKGHLQRMIPLGECQVGTDWP